MERIGAIRQVILRGSLWSFVAKCAGAAMAFVLQVVLARTLGVEEYGIVSYVLAWITVLAVVATVGLDKAALKFVAQYLDSKDQSLLHSYLVWGARVVLIVSLAIAVAFALSVLVISAESDQRMLLPMLLGAILIPLTALAQFYGETIRAARKVVLSEVPNMVVRPLIIAVSVVATVVIAGTVTTQTVMLINVSASVVVVWWLSVMVRRIAGSEPKGSNHAPARNLRAQWHAVAIPLLLVTSSNFLLARTDVIMLGSLAGASDAGTYNAAARLASLVAFPMLGIVAIVSPIMAQLSAAGRHADLQDVVHLAARLCFGAAVAVALVVAGMARPLLLLFGGGFETETGTVQILAAAQIVCAFVGPAGYVLAMTTGQRLLVMTTGGSAMLNILLNLSLIPRYGTTGAAIATAISLGVNGVANASLCLARQSINPSVWRGVRQRGESR